MTSSKMVVLRYSRNVFIDTETNTLGNGEKAKINFPSAAFSVKENEQMKLSLTSFTMRKSFYNINQTNGVFYLNDGTGTYAQIVIAPGDYTFATLQIAIGNAVTVAIPGSSCTYNSTSRKFTIILGPTAPAASFFVCFQVDSGSPPTGVNASFTDVHEILGCIPTRDFGNIKNAFGSSVGPGSHLSPYFGQLTSLENIYIRCDAPNNNFMTFGFEKNLTDKCGLTGSTIFAKVPVRVENDLIHFQDTNDIFNLWLNGNHLDSITFELTDDKNRFLPEMTTGANQDGALSFKMVLKWEIFDPSPKTTDEAMTIVNKQEGRFSMPV